MFSGSADRVVGDPTVDNSPAHAQEIPMGCSRCLRHLNTPPFQRSRQSGRTSNLAPCLTPKVTSGKIPPACPGPWESPLWRWTTKSPVRNSHDGAWHSRSMRFTRPLLTEKEPRQKDPDVNSTGIFLLFPPPCHPTRAALNVFGVRRRPRWDRGYRGVD